MSLGLPSHLARKANGRALARAAQAAALVCLAAAELSVLVPGVEDVTSAALGTRGDDAGYAGGIAGFIDVVGVPWLGVVAIIPLAIMLFVAGRRRTVPITVATLVIGMGSTFVYTLSLLAQNPSYHNTDLFVIALPVIAMTLVGGTGSGAFVGVIWASLGYLLGEISVFAASQVAERQFRFDGITLGVYLMIVAVMVLDGLTRNSKRGVQASILRMMRAEQTELLRRRATADAATDLHDTTLSQLTLIAQAEPGPLAPALRARIEADLAAWGNDRVVQLERASAEARTTEEIWAASELAAVIDQARDEGLELDVSGDRNQLARLDGDGSHALALAARQCLVNVLQHSGQTAADIVLSSTAEEVSVMVVDPGRGFVESDAASDRLGLQHSIRERIERVGGRVAIFSSPGAGTSVSMVVPAARRLSGGTDGVAS